MRSDVHTAALRAAAKVAFSVAFISGCGSPASPADATGGENADGTESDIKSGKKKAGTDTGCESEKDASAPKLTCDQVVSAAFPTEGRYPGTKQAVSAEVESCCEQLLTDSHGALANHRWDCCANLPADAGQGAGIACTPWGPPVPPSMKPRGSRMAEPLRLEVA